MSLDDARPFQLVNIPSISTWVVLGRGMRLVLTNPSRARIFNVAMAVMLIGSLYPIVLH